MMKKVLSHGAVGLLAAVLLGGTAYALVNPDHAQAQREAAGGPAQNADHGGTGQNSEGIGNGTASGGRGNGGGRGNAAGAETARGEDGYRSGQVEDLSAGEIQSILFMREEEKLARDVYLTLYDQWDLAIFENIASSEQTHMNAMGTLIQRYGLEDPTEANGVGEFADSTLQALYTDLITAGSESLSDALRVGAAIEEIDILDLEDYLPQTDAQDIERVYQNLLNGSRNHLRAFVRTLEQQAGEIYEPAYMDQAAFDAVLDGSVGGEGYGQGQGHAGRGGAGQTGRGEGALGSGQNEGRGGKGRASGGSASGYGQGGGQGNRNPDLASGRSASERAGEMVDIEWETVAGTVTVIDSEVTIETTDGELLVGMGQAAFWEEFALSVGDQITVTGFYEDGEFKAGTIENLTSGDTITLRDQTGRPVWSGRGRLQNR